MKAFHVVKVYLSLVYVKDSCTSGYDNSVLVSQEAKTTELSGRTKDNMASLHNQPRKALGKMEFMVHWLILQICTPITLDKDCISGF